MRWLERLFNRIHVALYRLSGGRVGAHLLGMDILLLSTRGRRSGRRRTTPLAYFRDGDCVFVIGADAGGPHHPGWYHNLRADPSCEIVIGARSSRVEAQLLDGPERDRLYRIFSEAAGQLARQYEAKTSRRFPVVRFRGSSSSSSTRPANSGSPRTRKPKRSAPSSSGCSS
jgi:deazaflavin-dependent oxidoreductase (nitroreductase family)